MPEHEHVWDRDEGMYKVKGEKETSWFKQTEGLLKNLEDLDRKHPELDTDQLFAIVEKVKEKAQAVDTFVSAKRKEGFPFPTEHLKPSEKEEALTAEFINGMLKHLIGNIDLACSREEPVTTRVYDSEIPYYFREKEERAKKLMHEIEALFGTDQKRYQPASVRVGGFDKRARDADIETRTGIKTGVIETLTVVPGLKTQRVIDRYLTEGIFRRDEALKNRVLALDLKFSPPHKE